MTIPEPLHGDIIKQGVNNPAPKRPAIAEGLIYCKSCLMIAADPGAGKSTLSLQTAMELTAGLPVFGALAVPRPMRVYYIQKERGPEEIFERMAAIQQTVPWNPENFWLDSELQRLNFANEAHANLVISRIARYKPDIIYIDPIYPGTKGLSKDEVASAYCDFLIGLEKETQASIWLNHHTSRDVYHQGAKVERDDPFYGSQWLKAHVTGSYYVTTTERGTNWKVKKSNHKNLLKEFDLSFDHETYCSTLEGHSMTATNRFMLFLEAKRRENKVFTFSEAIAYLGCTVSRGRQIFCTPPFSDMLTRSKSNGKATLYTVTPHL